jgi:hypothetical protein
MYAVLSILTATAVRITYLHKWIANRGELLQAGKAENLVEEAQAKNLWMC